MESFAGLAIMLGGPALYVWLQWRAIRSARGLVQWLAALVPVALVIAAAVWTSIGLAAGGNLAPLALVFSFPVAIVWLAIGEGVRFVRELLE